jgi:amino acid adenylation domain-containing protein/non-ribosomal peptide synthase protein (TIGR01720 family)
MIPHRSILNRLLWMVGEFRFGVGERVLQKTPFSFDASVWEFFVPLLTGGRVVMARPGGHQDTAYLVETIEREQVTTLQLVPSMLQVFLEEQGMERCGSLRRVFCGGEALGVRLKERFYKVLGAELHNLYGPTEVSIDATHWAVRDDEQRSVPIGRPIANTRLHLLDARMEPVPLGVAGELYIAGIGLARGYLGRPALTAERFVPDPHSREPGARLYRTGDVGRRRSDGVIEYLGRVDHQVKVRGFRIELGEIEAALLSHPLVRETVVTAREDDAGHKRLVAYFVGKSDEEASGVELKEFLEEKLPDYMVPALFVRLPQLPRQSNGKIDVRALPDPVQVRPQLRQGYVAPQTEVEKKLAQVWAEVLGVEQVGVNDNFFELGGDSILTLQITAAARRAGLRVTARKIFQYPTVAELATVVGDAQEAAAVDEPAAALSIPLTPIQRDFFERGDPEPHHYNQAVLLEVRRPLRTELLARVLRALLVRHDALRLRFVRDEGGWRQLVAAADTVPTPLTVVDLSALEEAGQRASIEFAAAEAQAGLNLVEGPLMRVVLFELGNGRPGRLLIVVHHLATDGVSWRILLEDLQGGYRQAESGQQIELPAVSTSFGRWAELLARHAGSGAFDGEADYWIGRSERRVEPLPVDHPGGDDSVAALASVSVSLSEEETRALLHDAPAAYHTQINDILLTALALAVTEHTGGTALRIDMEGHGREEILEGVDLSRTVGWFTAVFPVVLELSGARDEGEALMSVKEQLRAIPNRGIGYGLLKHMGRDERVAEQLWRRPPADISFNYLGQFDQTVSEESGLAGARESSGPGVSPRARLRHLLDINGSVMGGRLEIDWGYSRNLMEEETVRSLAERFLAALRRVIARCLAVERPVYTPSDFPLARLNQQEIDGLLAGGEEVEDIYALSPLQEGLLFHTLSAPASGVYMQQMSCRFNRGFDPAAFKRAWEDVIARHTILRTGFEWRGVSEPVQVVRRRVRLDVREEDWRGYGRARSAEELERFLREDRARGFDVSRPTLMRLALMREGEDAYRLVWSFHHLVLDGWSVGTVIQEVFEGYERRRQGAGPAERGGARPYRDYIRWLSRQDMAAAESYWRGRLKGSHAPTPLSLARAPHSPAPAEVGHAEQEMRLPQELKEFARRQQLTLNTVVQGAWALLLSRYSGERDVMFGAVVSGRPAALPGVETMVGLFINTLPVRVEVGGDERVGDWLRGLQQQQGETRQYEFSPLVQVQGWSDVPRSLPLFESILVFENFPSPDSSIKEQGEALEVTEIRTLEQTNYPLTILASSDAEASLMLRYDRTRFDDETVARMMGHWQTLLVSMAADPARRLSDLPILTPDERRLLLSDFHGTESPLPHSNTLHGLFERRAQRTPDAVAVVYEDERLSYAELNERAGRLASYLRARGVGPESVVAVLMERSLEMVVALYGVLKAGGAYLPVEPSYPDARIAYMLEDSRPALVLTQGRLSAKAPAGVEVLALDERWSEVEAVAGADAGEAQPEAGPDNIAYVIYTSGSTGRPKAVMSTHRGICNRLLWMQEEYGLDETDVVLQKTPFSFDVSVWEFFWPLLTGARLVVARPGGHQDAVYLAGVINEQHVTTLHFVPSMLQVFVEALEKCPSVRRVICSGEALPPELAARFFRHSRAELHNLYGPTEASVDVTYWECKPEDVHGGVPIGRPIANTRLHLLDARMEPVPLGVAGELYIAGIGLARGYLGRPALTAERFVPDPHSREPGARLYRTGDVGRRRSDGVIEYLGRVDHQVKVRGFRIELGEIEAALLSHPLVRETVVIAREQGEGEKSLVGYVVAEEGTEVGGRELREYLRERLPEYMTPSAFVSLPEMPLTSNGKIDRSRLPEARPARGPAEKAPMPPADETERRLLDIWEDLFRVRPLGVADDFFEIGGHSILALRLMSRVAREFGRELPLAALFERPTVEKLAALLRQHAPARPSSPLVPIQPEGAWPPFFCVHPSGGNVLCYHELSRALGADYPFHGLQDPPDFEGTRRHSEDIAEMAAGYVEVLRGARPGGPYLLGGYSFGGVVAFEMASQLRRQGQEVALLALLDTAAPHASRRLLELEERMGITDGVMLALDLKEHARQSGIELTLELRTLWRLGPDEQLAYVVERGGAAGLLPPEVGRAQIDRYLQLHRARRRAVRTYAPGLYDGTVTLLCAAEPAEDELRDLEGVAEPEILHEWRSARDESFRAHALGWGPLTSRPVEVRIVPGTHHTMLFGANATALAEILRYYIARSAGAELAAQGSSSTPQTTPFL